METVQDRRATAGGAVGETEAVLRVVAEVRREAELTDQLDEQAWFDEGEQQVDKTAMVSFDEVQGAPAPRSPRVLYAAALLSGAAVGFALVRALM